MKVEPKEADSKNAEFKKLKLKWSSKNQDAYYDAWLKTKGSLVGKTAVITGTTSGFGLTAARSLAELGCTLFLLNRDSERVAPALDSVRNAAVKAGQYSSIEDASAKIEHVSCDLTEFAQVRKAGEAVKAKLRKEGQVQGQLDFLICNAGVMLIPDLATPDGYDLQMQVNHLSHFLLTDMLLPELEAAGAATGDARIVNVSSSAWHLSACTVLSPYVCFAKDPRPKYLEKKGGNLGGSWVYPVLPMGPRMWRYAQSKLVQYVSTAKLQEVLEKKGSSSVKVFCCNPGICFETDLLNKESQKRNSVVGSQSLASFNPKAAPKKKVGGIGGFAKWAFNLQGHGLKAGAMTIMQACLQENVRGGTQFKCA